HPAMPKAIPHPHLRARAKASSLSRIRSERRLRKNRRDLRGRILERNIDWLRAREGFLDRRLDRTRDLRPLRMRPPWARALELLAVDLISLGPERVLDHDIGARREATRLPAFAQHGLLRHELHEVEGAVLLLRALR